MKNKVIGPTLPNFKNYCKATINETTWYCQKDRHIDQSNRIKSLEIHPYEYIQLIFDKGVKGIQQRKDRQPFQKMNLLHSLQAKQTKKNLKIDHGSKYNI